MAETGLQALREMKKETWLNDLQTLLMLICSHGDWENFQLSNHLFTLHIRFASADVFINWVIFHCENSSKSPLRDGGETKNESSFYFIINEKAINESFHAEMRASKASCIFFLTLSVSVAVVWVS